MMVLKVDNDLSLATDIRECIKQLDYQKVVRLRAGQSNPDKFKWDPSNSVRF
jgi:hypothetical protein